MTIRLVFELIVTAAIVLLASWIYLVYQADTAAKYTGYEAAVFVLPPLGGIAIGLICRQILNGISKAKRNSWQFGSTGAFSAIILPLLYIWTVSQPH